MSDDGFTRIEANDLKPVAVVAQSLDNQWVPRSVLAQMLARGEGLDDVQALRDRNVSAEFRRALLTSEQVVVNRVYLYNNASVSTEYREFSDRRSAFGELLKGGAIVPYLFVESSPTEPPGRMDVDQESVFAWERLCEEFPPTCLRLSWDDRENARATNEFLSNRFHKFAQTLNLLDAANLLVDLGYPSNDLPTKPFSRRLRDVARYAMDVSDDDTRVTRNLLYEKFISAEDTDVTAGIYDKNKPFASELKQLLDLSYNVNLPDAIDRFPLTPIDSLHRTALQELLLERQPAGIGSDELAHHLKQAAFSLSQGFSRERAKDAKRKTAALTDMLNGLSLPTIVKVRNESSAWLTYIARVRDLLDDPLSFAKGGADRVFEGYSDLLRHAGEVEAADSGGRIGERLVPGAALIVEAGGAVLTILIGEDTAMQVGGAVGSIVGGKALPIVVRLVTGGFTRRRQLAAISSSVDIMRRQLVDGKREWSRIVDELSNEPSFAVLPSARAGHHVANMGESDR